MLRSLFLALVLLVSGVAEAQTVAPKLQRKQFFHATTNSKKLLAGVALNATAGTRTVTLDVSGLSSLIWQVDLTRSAVTSLTMTCTASLNAGSSYANENSVAIAAGTATLTTLTWTKTLSASQNELIKLDVSVYDKISCLFGGASAGGSDLVDVYAIGSSGA